MFHVLDDEVCLRHGPRERALRDGIAVVHSEATGCLRLSLCHSAAERKAAVGLPPICTATRVGMPSVVTLFAGLS
ncbi:hypothetical protein HII31_02565 [Pseudocercospora fuligena]|uniref:Uncharacterized protein n=1 Tax=Pseudocercospora fuligena TaxID=685502 RepID=A0A8H6RRH4_9PEZI|nr:hypothetical protein HII31_02565 [Pseudocercospora fuligena]